jgi:hypothetical protein
MPNAQQPLCLGAEVFEERVREGVIVVTHQNLDWSVSISESLEIEFIVENNLSLMQ